MILPKKIDFEMHGGGGGFTFDEVAYPGGGGVVDSKLIMLRQSVHYLNLQHQLFNPGGRPRGGSGR